MFARAVAASLVLAATSLTTAEPQSQPGTREAQVRWTQECKDWDEWDKPAPPFNIYGGTYYVGTCGISAILITTGQGNIVIDGGPAGVGGLIARNIEALGFNLGDVHLLLNTHEHHDHVGGLADLQRLTGSVLFASKEAATVLASGAAGKDDPQFAEHGTFPPVKVGGIVRDGELIEIGDLKLKAIATPGHTPGALSWQWRSCKERVCKTIVYADSLTPVSSDGYRFTDHPSVVANFRSSLAKIAGLDCDILLSPHPSASGMRDKLARGDLTTGPTCKDYAANLSGQLDERLAKEADGG
jgi:metallo-beta-lactamase class B